MVAFARAKAKSIFSRLQFIIISKKQIQTQKRKTNEELSNENERRSNSFLEAIKSGGIWLS